MCLCSRRACGEQASIRGAAIPAKTRRHRMSCNVGPRRGLLRHSGTTHASCKQATSSRFPSCTLLYQWPRRLCVRHPMTRYVAPHVRTSSQKPFSPARGTAAPLSTSADLDIESVDTAALIFRIWSDTPRQNPWGTSCRVLDDRSPASALRMPSPVITLDGRGDATSLMVPIVARSKNTPSSPAQRARCTRMCALSLIRPPG